MANNTNTDVDEQTIQPIMANVFLVVGLITGSLMSVKHATLITEIQE